MARRKPDQIHPLAQSQRATADGKEAVLNRLLQKFNLEAKKKNEDKNPSGDGEKATKQIMTDFLNQSNEKDQVGIYTVFS